MRPRVPPATNFVIPWGPSATAPTRSLPLRYPSWAMPPAPVFCSGCGRELSIRPVGVPVCPACSERFGGSQEATWQVRLGDGRLLPPVTRQRLVEQVRKGQVGPEDRVSVDGGSWARADQVPELLGWFIPGDARQARRTQELGAREQELRRHSRRALLRRLFGGGGALLVVALPVGLWFSGVEPLPPATREAATQALRDGVASMQTRVRKAAGDETVWDEERRAAGPPGAAELEALLVGVPTDADAAAEVAEGWRALASGRPADLALALERARRAVAASPEEPAALGLLAVALAHTGDDSAAMSAATLLERSRYFQDEGLELWRARAGVGHASGAWSAVLESTGRCLAADPADGWCAWYQAEALAALGDPDGAARAFEVASLAFPGSALLATAQARHLQGRLALAEARSRLEAAIGRSADHPAPRLELANLLLAVGDVRGARAQLAAVRAALPDHAEARLLDGRLALHGEGDVRAARAVLDPLAREAAEGTTSLRSSSIPLLFHAATLAAFQAGDFAAATGWSEQTLATRPTDGVGLVLASMVHLKSDGLEAAEADLAELRLEHVPAHERARALAWRAQVFRAGQHLREAAADLEGAHQLAPWEVDLALARAELALQTGDVPAALEVVEGLVSADLEATTTRSVLGELPLPSVPTDLLREPIRQVGRAEARFEGRARVAGWTLDLVDCVRQGRGCADLARDIRQEGEPSDPRVWALLGRALYAAGDLPGAAAALERATVEPEPVLEALRGLALARLGRMTEADQAFARASGGGGSAAAVSLFHGEALRQLGREDEARSLLERAATADPLDVRARRELLALGG